jgi:CHAT domain-containing protein/tetratricopeptide (TPR) repeat protein
MGLFLGLVCASSPAQQPASPPAPADVHAPVAAKSESDMAGQIKPGQEAIAKAKEALAKADSERPGNLTAIVDALSVLVGRQIESGLVDESTLAQANREVQVAAAASGPESRTAVGARGDLVEVMVRLSHVAEARSTAERSFEIAQRDFPGTDDYATTADELGFTCSRLGDFSCALRAYQLALETRRKIGGNDNPDLIFSLNHLAQLRYRMGDIEGAVAADEEGLALTYRLNPQDNRIPINENNLGSRYTSAQKFDKAFEHLDRALAMMSTQYSPDSVLSMQVHSNLATLYTRTGRLQEAWKAYEFALNSAYAPVDIKIGTHWNFALSLAQGSSPSRAVEEGLTCARMSRELFVLEARTLPERQALAYDASRPHGLDASLSVVLKHPEVPADGVYQEMVRSRALVSDEMARRQKNLNANSDPETAQLQRELDQARTNLLAVESSKTVKANIAELVESANRHMEQAERTLAEHSAVLRADERIYQVTTEDVRQNLPPHSVLISYVQFHRQVVDAVDPAAAETPAYMAFVIHPDTKQIHLYDLGDAAPVDDLVQKTRAAADSEAHGGGMGSARNERNYRAAALELRHRIWDPLKAEIGDVRLALVVADGNLNLIPFAGLPDGAGYMVEHGPVIHTLSSERDLVPTAQGARNQGLFAIGSPTFQLSANKVAAVPLLRGASPACAEFDKIEFQPLPGTAGEVSDVGSSWRRWNNNEKAELVTGDGATLARFLADAGQSRVLHIATHAFLLDKECGSGNPLLHSGLVFAGGSHGGAHSVLTAQQIASLDLTGVDWAVLSACNTGNGELRDGEGVLGLERAFRVAGARSVIMTLWPVDDQATRQFMHELYAQRLGQRATTADAVWDSARVVLLKRRAAGKSTHPWYWAGFVGSGRWE